MMYFYDFSVNKNQMEYKIQMFVLSKVFSN